MDRRALLVTIAGSVGIAGCVATDPAGSSTTLSSKATDSDREPSATTGKSKQTPTAVRKTADGVSATFRVVGSRGAPLEESVDATFDGNEVTLTGSIDPAGCNEPTLESVDYDASAGRVILVVGEVDPYADSTVTAECGNAVYEFRSAVTVDEGTPTVVTVTYDGPSDDQTFTVERD